MRPPCPLHGVKRVPVGIIHKREVQFILSVILQTRVTPQESAGQRIDRVVPRIRNPAVRIGAVGSPVRQTVLFTDIRPYASRRTVTAGSLRVIRPRAVGMFRIWLQTREYLADPPLCHGVCAGHMMDGTVKRNVIIRRIRYRREVYDHAVESRLRRDTRRYGRTHCNRGDSLSRRVCAVSSSIICTDAVLIIRAGLQSGHGFGGTCYALGFAVKTESVTGGSVHTAP